MTRFGHVVDVHVVVKNSPFQLICRMRGVSVDLHKFSHDLKLMYDMEEEKEVSWVKQKPVEYKMVVSEDGAQISLEAIKIKVLSSHHEDNMFRLRLSVWDPANEAAVYMVASNPIKVISKPLKHRSKRASTASQANLLMGFAGHDDDSSPEPSPRRPLGVKRQHGDMEAASTVSTRASPYRFTVPASPAHNHGGGHNNHHPMASSSASSSSTITTIADPNLMNKVNLIQEEQRRTADELKKIRELMEHQTYFDTMFPGSSKRPKLCTPLHVPPPPPPSVTSPLSFLHHTSF
jgi:hypothetical protein